MMRPALAAFLGAAFGALAFPGVRDRLVYVPVEFQDLAAVAWTACAAAFLALVLMACREIPRLQAHPVRDRAGRFVKAPR